MSLVRNGSRRGNEGPTSVHQLFDDKTEKPLGASFDVSFLDFVPCIACTACTHLAYSLFLSSKNLSFRSSTIWNLIGQANVTNM